MNYSFDIEDAKKYGVNEAIMINNFKFWIIKNHANNKHRYKDRTWTYNSLAALGELFPFWTVRQIRYTLESLINQGILIFDNFNEDKRDRTLWYAFKDESFLGLNMSVAFDENGKSDLTKSESAFDENGKCIIGNRYKHTDINNTDNKTSELIHSEDKSSSFINSSPCVKNENPNLQKCEKGQISVHLPDFVNPALWDDWTRHRREIGHSLKPTTIQKQLKQLAEWHKQGYDVNKIIEQSIINGWQGLFLPKKTKIEQNPLPDEIEQAVREGRISEEGAYSYASAMNWLKRYEGEA
ncbi:MAG: hypothetical protein LBB59_04645 [Campylobacteraceae bacterium]|jgi:hypothetical protein|nr:hypothetical protein [Campylobacteraceae bacterium]